MSGLKTTNALTKSWTMFTGVSWRIGNANFVPYEGCDLSLVQITTQRKPYSGPIGTCATVMLPPMMDSTERMGPKIVEGSTSTTSLWSW